MKKFFLYFLSIFFIFTIFLSLSSCNKNMEEIISQNVSETRENYYFASDEDYYVSFTDGMRESSYVMDGKSSPLVEYGVLVLKTSKNLGEHPRYILKVGEKEYSGNMEINPFDLTYVADISQKIENFQEISLFLPNFNKNFILTCISSSWEITPTKALNIFIQEKYQALKPYFENEAKAEIYVKLVGDKSDPNNIFYYILCVTQDGEVMGSLIDVHTGSTTQK